jgi:hypothetical protein
MYNSIVDLTALMRAILISLGCGLILMALAFFVTKTPPERKKWKTVIIFGVCGIMLIICVLIYSLWPSLIAVPDLGNLSQAEAERRILSYHLVPEPKPQYSSNTEEGRVIPNSQVPQPGLKVNKNSTVLYSVSISKTSEVSKTDSIADTEITFSFFNPQENNKILCSCDPEGICSISVTGTSNHLFNSDFDLLLWIRPVRPSSEYNGWYLQRPPNNGINNIEEDGSWSGSAQIGNNLYPPHEGDIIDIAISCADRTLYDNLMNESGVVRRRQPIGNFIRYRRDVEISLKKN